MFIMETTFGFSFQLHPFPTVERSPGNCFTFLTGHTDIFEFLGVPLKCTKHQTSASHHDFHYL